MKEKENPHIIHKLKYFGKFDRPIPDVFHKIYFKLTEPYIGRKKVLNIGCWTGSYETMFKDKDCNVVSIDLSFQALQIAKKANPHCSFLQADALALPFKKECFDVITLFTVLEHLPKGSEQKVFREISCVLKEGGLLVITTPHDNLIGNILDVAHWLVGHRHYKVKFLKGVLETCGFRMEKMMLKGKLWSNFSIVFFYLFKYLFRFNIYKNQFVKKVIEAEYAKDGYRDIFLVCQKITKGAI
jgi:SAM-dependent methyltransferase